MLYHFQKHWPIQSDAKLIEFVHNLSTNILYGICTNLFNENQNIIRKYSFKIRLTLFYFLIVTYQNYLSNFSVICGFEHLVYLKAYLFLLYKIFGCFGQHVSVQNYFW